MVEAEATRTKAATKDNYVSYKVNSSYLAYLYIQLLLSDTFAVPIVAAVIDGRWGKRPFVIVGGGGTGSRTRWVRQFRCK